MNTFSLAVLRIARGKGSLKILIGIISIIQFSVFALSFILPRIEAQSTEYALGGLTGAQKWLSVAKANGSNLGSLEVSQSIENEFSSLSDSKVRHAIAYRPISDEFAGRYQLIGTDQIEQEVKLLDGVYPKACKINFCEVILVNPNNLTKLPEGLKVVGTGELSKDSPITPTIEAGTALLIANSSKDVILVNAVNGFPASELWSIEISNSEIKSIGLKNYLQLIQTFSNNLNTISDNLLISGPISLLETTRSQTLALVNRIYSLIFSICLISFISIFFISSAAKSDNKKFLKSVQRVSGKKYSVESFSFFISAICTLSATLIGFLFANLAGFVATQSINFSLVNSLLPIYILVTSLLIMLFAFLDKTRSKVFSFSILLLATFIFIIFASIDAKFSLIPISSILIVLAINFAIKATLKNNFIKNTFLSKQKYFFALGFITSLFLASIMSAIYYLNSLNLNVEDNAIFQSPTKLRITSGSEAQPMQNNSITDYEKLAGKGEVFSVRKISAVFSENLVSAVPTQIVGVDSNVWNFVPNITHQTDFDLKKSKLAQPNSQKLFGVSVPGSSSLKVDVAGLNPNTSLGVWILNDRAESQLINLIASCSNFETKLPDNAESIIGFQITELPDFKARREHAVGEGKNSLPAPQGSLSLTNLKANSVTLNFDEVTNFDYSLLDGPVYLSQVKSPEVISAIVDRDTATALQRNDFQLKLSNKVSMRLEKVEVANLLPTVPMRFALVDPDQLTGFLAANSPELLRISEVWVTSNLPVDSANKANLSGLTLIEQDDIFGKNLAPSNAKWSQYSLLFMTLIALILFVLISYFVILEIVKDKQFAGWFSSGNSLPEMLSGIRKILFIYIFSSGVAGITTSIFGSREFIKRAIYDINGNIAFPPLVVKEDFVSLVTASLIFLIIANLVIYLGTKKLLVSGKNNAD